MQLLLWLSNNLRLNDNPALIAAIEQACESNEKLTVHPIYIIDTTDPWALGGANKWWLHHSLASLSNDLKKYNAVISLFMGDPEKIFATLLEQNTTAIFCSAHIEKHNEKKQENINQLCDAHNATCKRFACSLLFNPYKVTNKQGGPYKVFTPYYKYTKQAYPPNSTKVIPNPAHLKACLSPTALPNSLSLNALNLLPTLNWADNFKQHWQVGEKGASQRLKAAIKETISDYSTQRDLPEIDGTSRLSPYLRFGEISPREIWNTTASTLEPEKAEPFLRQLVWREFSHMLLANWKDFDKKPFREDFERFPWVNNKTQLNAWQKGQTGYPIVDAGMRQLWQTGWMHNRVRMITASFLTKHLRIHWKEGADWFWDTLLDADLANNSAGWQWVAGCGADAAPYFRIFNPILQGQKFDKKGHYVRKWVPELKDMPDKYIHAPWEAPEDVLQKAGVTLDHTYPSPIVDHKQARQAALEAYKQLKEL